MHTTGQPNDARHDDLPGDVACALRACADLEREASVLQCAASARQDAYTTQQVRDIHDHIVAAHRLLRALQTHVGRPARPMRLLPRVDIAEAPTTRLMPPRA